MYEPKRTAQRRQIIIISIRTNREPIRNMRRLYMCVCVCVCGRVVLVAANLRFDSLSFKVFGMRSAYRRAYVYVYRIK